MDSQIGRFHFINSESIGVNMKICFLSGTAVGAVYSGTLSFYLLITSTEKPIYQLDDSIFEIQDLKR